MSKAIIFVFLLICIPSFTTAQEAHVSLNSIVGCWEVLNDKTSDMSKTYVPCGAKPSSTRIEFNSYGEFTIYQKSSGGKCGTILNNTHGRYIFNKHEQTLKLRHSSEQRFITWNITKNSDEGFSLEKN